MGGTKSSSTSRLALLDLKYSEVTVCGPRWCSPLQQPIAPVQGSPCVRCFVSESVSCCIALYSRPVSNGTPQAKSSSNTRLKAEISACLSSLVYSCIHKLYVMTVLFASPHLHPHFCSAKSGVTCCAGTRL